MKRAIVTLALIPVVVFCLLAGVLSFAVGKAYITNNRILDEYEQEFHTIPHPTNTSAVAFKRRVTRPTGNGSHCFYFVCEVRRFSSNRSSIETFYVDKQIQLQFFEDNQLNQLSNWGIFKTSSDENFYLVYTLNTRIDDYNKIDLRCS